MAGHPVTQLVEVVVAATAVSAVLGLLKWLRKPAGALAYIGLMATFYAYHEMGDRYFSEGIWEISLGCMVVMGFTVQRVPFMRTVLAIGFLEFAARMNKTAYPYPTVLAIGLLGAIIAIATFSSPRSAASAPPTAPPEPPAPPAPPARAYRRGLPPAPPAPVFPRGLPPAPRVPVRRRGAPPAPPAPPLPPIPIYPRGPELFDPYTGKRLRKQRNSRLSPAGLWRRARGQR